MKLMYVRWMVGLVLPFSILLYIGLPIWMLARRWPIRAGFAMIASALLPWVVWLTMIAGRLGPGAGIAMLLTALMAILALVPIAIGLFQVIGRLTGPKQIQPD